MEWYFWVIIGIVIMLLIGLLIAGYIGFKYSTVNDSIDSFFLDIWYTSSKNSNNNSSE